MDLSGLTQPATTLIEKVSSAIGVLYEPSRTRKLAKAEADSKLISLDTDIKAAQIQKRAAHRLAVQEIKYQENLESILRIGVEAANSFEIEVESPSEDYLINFFNASKNVSDPELQSIWGRILAGSFVCAEEASKQTLDVMRVMSTRDARIFLHYSEQLVEMNGIHFRPKFKYTNMELNRNNINLGKIGHLDDLGLIRMDSVFFLADDPVEVSVGGKECVAKSKSRIHIKGERLTLAGEELIRVIDYNSDPKLFDNFISQFSNQCEFSIME